MFNVERAGERIRQNALVDWQGRLPVHSREGCLRLHSEESEAGADRCHEDPADY